MKKRWGGYNLIYTGRWKEKMFSEIVQIDGTYVCNNTINIKYDLQSFL